jgi:hypothetical protein
MEKLLWSIALPGFGQLLNGKFLKGMLLISLEFLINIQANFNEVIILNFLGRTEEAIQQTNYGWLMFYPCLYFFRCGMLLKMQAMEKNLIHFYHLCVQLIL